MGAQISSRVFRSPRVVMADGDAVDVESEEIRCGNRVFSGRSAPALRQHPVNKDLIAHFKSKGGDSVSWGIAESVERYEEETKKKVLRGADIASLYDQETERELAKEVENRIEAVLSAIEPGRVVMAGGDTAEVESEEIRCGNSVFSGRSAPVLHEHPINKDLIAHFKSKGDSVSWGIAESIERYEEGTEKKVSRGADIASLYDQETELELAREVENRIEEALSAGVWHQSCTVAAEGGQLECLKYLHENGCAWDKYTCLAAARGGRLECLKYLHENGCPWDSWSCTAAAGGGHLECFKYLRENGCVWRENTCTPAAKSGNLEFLKYLHENGCAWDKYTCAAASGRGHLECLKYLHENGCDWNEGMCTTVAKDDDSECKYSHEHNSRKRKTSS